jgi:regulator of protease activity HflC (stomatin/prohibitin superfamily)
VRASRANDPCGDGERQAAILQAEGFSQALERIFGAARGVDEKTMALQYLKALKALGAGSATKFVIPMEFTQLMRPFATYVEQGMNADAQRPAV